MKNLEKLKEFPIDERFVKSIGKGSFGEVYRLNENQVGKFLFCPSKEKLQSEYEICMFAYENSISVPKPEGVFNVLHPKEKQIYSAFVMEYISGETFSEFYQTWKIDMTEMWDLAEKENEKLRKINIFNGDFGAENAIWCPEKKKIYLVDFGHWKFNDIA
jgi:serine/threonine protein kinase